MMIDYYSQMKHDHYYGLYFDPINYMTYVFIIY
jgi:hypothetical protein